MKMTLNHSKTWPVSTLAVVQLRVDPNGRTYSTQLQTDFPSADMDIPHENGVNTKEHIDKIENNQNASKEFICTDKLLNENELVFPLSQQHVEIFTRRQMHPFKTTVRTDTVSTILDQEVDLDSEIIGLCNEEILPRRIEKFHVLALARIDESMNETDNRGRRPSVKVDNWDLIYTERESVRNKRCPACTSRCNETVLPNYGCKNKPSGDYNDRLIPDLPLDARKVTTLKRHYYPEGGWGWVIIVCTMLVHILNVGLQLSCSQLVMPGAEKFKTLPVHIAGEFGC